MDITNQKIHSCTCQKDGVENSNVNVPTKYRDVEKDRTLYVQDGVNSVVETDLDSVDTASANIFQLCMGKDGVDSSSMLPENICPSDHIWSSTMYPLYLTMPRETMEQYQGLKSIPQANMEPLGQVFRDPCKMVNTMGNYSHDAISRNIEDQENNGNATIQPMNLHYMSIDNSSTSIIQNDSNGYKPVSFIPQMPLDSPKMGLHWTFKPNESMAILDQHQRPANKDDHCYCPINNNDQTQFRNTSHSHHHYGPNSGAAEAAASRYQHHLYSYSDYVDLSTYEDDGKKPPFSYASLIAQAISSSPEKRLTLSGIYQYITSNYSYYRDQNTGWQNSIRHNLSLNKCFVKVARGKGEPGKGAFWEMDPKFSHLYVNGTLRHRKMTNNSRPKKKKTSIGSLQPYNADGSCIVETPVSIHTEPESSIKIASDGNCNDVNVVGIPSSMEKIRRGSVTKKKKKSSIDVNSNISDENNINLERNMECPVSTEKSRRYSLPSALDHKTNHFYPLDHPRSLTTYRHTDMYVSQPNSTPARGNNGIMAFQRFTSPDQDMNCRNNDDTDNNSGYHIIGGIPSSHGLFSSINTTFPQSIMMMISPPPFHSQFQCSLADHKGDVTCTCHSAAKYRMSGNKGSEFHIPTYGDCNPRIVTNGLFNCVDGHSKISMTNYDGDMGKSQQWISPTSPMTMLSQYYDYAQCTSAPMHDPNTDSSKHSYNIFHGTLEEDQDKFLTIQNHNFETPDLKKEHSSNIAGSRVLTDTYVKMHQTGYGHENDGPNPIMIEDIRWSQTSTPISIPPLFSPN